MMNEPPVLPASAPDKAESPLEAETARLARLISAYTPRDGYFTQPVPGLFLSRFSAAGTGFVKNFFMPSLAIVAQGEVSITMGREIRHAGKTQISITPVALPVSVQITQASPSEPYLSVKLDFDLQRMGELVLKVYPHGLPSVSRRSAGYFMNADVSIMRAMTRLLECLSNPGDVDLIAPLILDEILIRLLRSPLGIHIAEMGYADSDLQRIAKVTAWLRDHFTEPVRVADLADLVHLSPSAFHKQFKEATSMSPLQYQKALRLHRARRLMAADSLDAAAAARLVGYVSDSQFSRDYSRFFGLPPKRDIDRLRLQGHPPD